MEENRVLTIDVGIHNLAICIARPGEPPEHWKVFECFPETLTKNTSIATLREALVDTVDRQLLPIIQNRERPIQRVFIEQQPTRNTTMLTLQHVLGTWFQCREPHLSVKTMSGKLKLRDHVDQKELNYNQRKKAAIETTRHYFEERGWSLDRFESEKKKDDLADTFLMALVAHKIHEDKPKKRQTKRRKKNEPAETRAAELSI